MRVANDPLGGAAEEDMLQSRIPMSTNHDEVGPKRAGRIWDFRMRSPHAHECLSSQTCANTFFAECGQTFASGFDKRLIAFVQWWRDAEVALWVRRWFDDVQQCEFCAERQSQRYRVIQGTQRAIREINRHQDLFKGGRCRQIGRHQAGNI